MSLKAITKGVCVENIFCKGQKEKASKHAVVSDRS